ncbi:MAG UNVERIFIED_CONTAM: chloride channel protein [Anaerolineae bacterium]|jgi:CIC family chloride channel protein
MKTSLRPSDTLWVLLPALLVGLGTGLFVLFFRRSIEFVHHYWYDTFSAGWVASTLTQLNLNPRWHAAISLGLAGLLIGLLTRFFLTPDKYHGVSNLIVATAVGGGKLRFREMPIKAVASAFSLGAGASLGPEDPSVQIGANWGSFVGTFLRLPEVNVRLMVAAGTASAVAAAFNAPIAGCSSPSR